MSDLDRYLDKYRIGSLVESAIRDLIGEIKRGDSDKPEWLAIAIDCLVAARLQSMQEQIDHLTDLLSDDR